MHRCVSISILTSLVIAFVAPARAADPGRLSLVRGDRVVLTYNADHVPSPDSKQPWYGRSGFIHPVRTPSGRIVTEGFPADHMHQHGLMFAWTSSVFDGHAVDFWNSRKQQGVVEHIETIEAGDDRIVVRLRHVDRTTTPTTVVLNERWQITLVPHDSMHVFDLVSTQTCAGEKPLEIQQYHYGAMCIRGPSEWLGDRVTLRTSDGSDRIKGNHTRPRWVTMDGIIDGARCGITAMSHPENFRAPQPVRLHPRKPYFCFAPMVLGDFSIQPEEPYVSRYRFVAFDGEADDETLDSLWKEFSN